MKNLTSMIGLALGAAALATAGCGSDTPPPRAPTAYQQGGEPQRQQPVQQGNPDVTIDVAIVDACKIPTPKFEFDSSSVRPRAEDPLQLLAQCFLTGPIAGQKVKLVGHADPRGTVEYNMALGQQRAGSVGEALDKAGMPPSRISTMSHGELFAKGTNEASWKDDRRVEIFLDR